MKHKQRGMTLMELMVVMVIVGILAAIAIPAYRRYVVRANRADAKTALLQTAQAYERCYTNSSPYQYDSVVCSTAGTGVILPFTVPSGTYTITNTNPGPNTYTLVATPVGPQLSDDTECGSFGLTQAGVQSVTGTLIATPDMCWRR